MSFAGSPARVEARLVPEAGFDFHPFEVSGFERKLGWKLLRSLPRALAAVRACGRIVDDVRPDVVLGGGGYVAGPMIVAAARRRVPTAVMEADAHLGLANRLAAPFARRVFLAFPIPGREGPKYRLTGRPIPARSRPVDGTTARRRFDLPVEGPVLLVFGGSQGARALNEFAVESWGAAGPAVLHLSGERDFASLRDRVGRPDYRLLAFTDDFGAAVSAADLVLARAGGSVWELAAAGKPAVLVPYPHATADHQAKNARTFEQAGGAVIVAERDLESRGVGVITSLLADAGRRGAMAEAMRRAGRPDAAQTIAAELLALARSPA